jgi:hypothetical protein
MQSNLAKNPFIKIVLCLDIIGEFKKARLEASYELKQLDKPLNDGDTKIRICD